MALPSTLSRVLILLVLLVALAGQLISLGGLAKLTNLCVDSKNPPIGGGKVEYSCGIYYSLYWWIIFLEGFAVVAGLLASFVSALNNRYFILHVFAIATTLYTLLAQNYVQSSYVLRDADTETADATKAVAAGTIIVLVSNFLFAILYSRDPASADAAPAVKA